MELLTKIYIKHKTTKMQKFILKKELLTNKNWKKLFAK